VVENEIAVGGGNVMNFWELQSKVNSPFVLLENLLDFLQVIAVFHVEIEALVGDELALLQEFFEVRLGCVGFVANVLAEFLFALKGSRFSGIP
jgi:hypothetical protein